MVRYNANTIKNRFERKRKKKFRKTKKHIQSNKFRKIKGGYRNNNNSNLKYNITHPLSKFIEDKVGDGYILTFHEGNNNLFNEESIYVKAFVEKMLEIMRFSFNRERMYHIGLGNYPSSFEHQSSSIIENIKNSRYLTIVLATGELIPIGFLYVELASDNSNNYDKVWTVCTDPNRRGEGNSTKVMNHLLKRQKKNNRNNMLLEIYNDNEIKREEEEPKQNHIAELFSKMGFQEVNQNQLKFGAENNILGRNGETKVMVIH